ncbi:hypothetical protein [Streptomyces sp. NPDC059247]|uniref:hypothetical protein n=1 Tax=Streptomyces sp. NPDC059247 TaxID=3346790 RepID=UPI00369AB6EE
MRRPLMAVALLTATVALTSASAGLADAQVGEIVTWEQCVEGGGQVLVPPSRRSASAWAGPTTAWASLDTGVAKMSRV